MTDDDFDILDDLPAGLAGRPVDATYPGVPPAVADPRTADVYEVLDELSDMIEMARAVPMSDRCVIPRNAALDLLDSIRGMLPRAVQEAEEILADRVGVVEDAYREAERLIADARGQSDQLLAAAQAERTRLIDAHAVTAGAVAQAEALRAQTWAEVEAMRSAAIEETQRMRAETDEYIDAKFASFEATLSKTLNVVARGRERLGTRTPQRPDRHM